jgi:hypothetical protein
MDLVKKELIPQIFYGVKIIRQKTWRRWVEAVYGTCQENLRLQDFHPRKPAMSGNGTDNHRATVPTF